MITLTRARLELTVLGLCTLLGLLSTPALSGSIAIQSDTVLRSFKRVTVGGANDSVVPIYEYLKLDVEQIGSEYLSFHAYGWGRLDAADSGYYGNQAAGVLMYGYLEYADIYQGRSLRLGRQHILEGVANDAIDGLRVRSDLGDQLSISAYGGLPVGFDNATGRSGDSILGGRLAHRFEALSDVGVSYKMIKDNGTKVSSMLGIDSAFFLPWDTSLYGNSVRNMDTSGWAEHSYKIRIKAGDVTISPLYEMFQYDQYFGARRAAAGPFRSLANSDERLQAIGVNLDWRASTNWVFGAKAKGYSYNLDSSASYASASVSWFGEALTQAGGEVGRMQGGAADKNYLLIRMFFYMDRMDEAIWADFISADVVFTRYDQDIYGKDHSYCIFVGSGKTYDHENLEIKISADYSVDPYFDSDIRAMMTVTYRFNAGF